MDRAGSAATPEVFAAREAGGSLRDDLRGMRVVWRRELIRFTRNRTRMVTALAQPILFLFVLGTGLAPLAPSAGGNIDFRTFMFPGVLAMVVLFTSIFSAISIVWDREFGFLREMMVAPVRRSALVVGKVLGGGTVATLQGTIMLALAGLVGIPYSPPLLLILVLEMALGAFVLTSFGVMLASRMSQVESFQMVMQFFLLPMFFLSGALFPLTQLPRWLNVLTKINPLSYVVDPMRRAVFAYVDAPAELVQSLNPGMSWGGWLVPVWLEFGALVVLGAIMLAVAVVQFSKQD